MIGYNNIRLKRQRTKRENAFRTQTGNDPSEGSPMETLLRLLLSLDDAIRTTSRNVLGNCRQTPRLQSKVLTVQLVVAMGGVYKGQGRNQRELMTHAY